MRQEALRLDRVTVIDQGTMVLNHFSLHIFAGEIMGLVPINGTGLSALLRLLRQNIPLHYGYVHYRERLINHWLYTDGRYNRIALIENRSGLADDLTVADNVFVLRQGFKKRIIHRSALNRMLEPFLADTGMHISAGAYTRDLTAFQRFVVEIVKAVVAGCRLIILRDLGNIISDAELAKLWDILRFYQAQGIAFLCVSRHYEEVRSICDRVALMVNGQIAKVLSTKDITPDMIHYYAVENYEQLVRTQGERRTAPMDALPALSLENLAYGAIRGLSFSVMPGECVVLQDLENRIFEDLIAVATGEGRGASGRMMVGGKPFRHRRDIAIIQRLAAGTMLFPELSYMDNLCFTMDHRLPKIWLQSRAKRGIRKEYGPWLGADVFDKHIEELTLMQRYDLMYARVLLQRPKAVLCMQPFMQADVGQRMHIWQLIERLLEKDIAVCILAVNLADTLSLADRLIQIQNGREAFAYARSEFGNLPQSAPWRHLWQEERNGPKGSSQKKG